MLPSKGYFKSLDCPYYERGFCNRPHCHFRHIRRDNYDLIDEVYMESSALNSPSSEEGTVPKEQAPAHASYKPTPIAELKKRHLPVTSVPGASVASNKRKIEPYNVKSVRRPKEEYNPEGNTATNNLVYKATKICEKSSSNKSDLLDNGLDNEEDEGSSDEETDIDKVTKELDVIGKMLKMYDNGVTMDDIGSEISTNEASLEPNSEDMFKTSSESCEEKTQSSKSTCNGHLDGQSVEAKTLESSKDSSKDSKSNRKVSASSESEKSVDKGSGNTHKQNTKESKITDLFEQNLEKKDSDDKSKKQNHHHSSSSRKSGKENKHSHTSSSSSKHSRRDSEHSRKDSESSKLDSKHSKTDSQHSNKNSENHNKNSEHSKKESELSKKNSEHKHSSSKKSSHRSSSTSKSSSKDYKSSSKSSNKDSDMSSSDKLKSKSKHKSSHRDLSKSSSKNTEESKYRTKERSRSGDKERHKSSSSSSRKSRERVESKSSPESEDDVEILSDKDSIIVIDSDDEKEKTRKRKRKSSRSEERIPEKRRYSSSHKHSGSKRDRSDSEDSEDAESPGRSPCLPSDVSSSEEEPEVVASEPGSSTAADTANEIDMRVMSKMKTRVSLGNVWRPQTKVPVKILTPAERLMLFRKKAAEAESSENIAKPKISGVPNVQSLLQEKKRLNGSSILEFRRNLAAQRKMEEARDPENKDAPPDALVIETKRSSIEDKSDREYGMRLLWAKFRQLVVPGDSYKTQRTRCQVAEREIFQASCRDKYFTDIKRFALKMEERQIAQFTQKHFRVIQPPLDKLFPPELNPDKGHKVSLYSALMKYTLTAEQLEAEGYPRKCADFEESGKCFISLASILRWRRNGKMPETCKSIGELTEFICANCGKPYKVDDKTSLSTSPCSYHSKGKKPAGRGGQDKEPKYRCCGMNQPCMTSEHHSTEFKDLQRLDGFLETPEPLGDMPAEGWGIFAMDCEMYWSTGGLEVGRVSLVNIDNRCVYDAFIKNERLVTDYSTKKSGLTKELLDGGRLFEEVRQEIFEIINSKTILIGHSLDNDLKVMKMLHNTVVDTSVVYSKTGGKFSLQMLAENELNMSVQNDDTTGHSSIEDSEVCLKLMLKHVFRKSSAHVPVKVRAPPHAKPKNIFN